MVKAIKKAKSFDKNLRPVRVYEEDLNELLAILKETCKEVEISNDDYKFESIEDVREHLGARTIHRLNLSGSYPRADVDFRRYWTKISVGSGEKSAQLFHDLCTVMQRRQRWVWSSYWIILASMMLSGIAYVLPEPYNGMLSALGALLTAIFLWFMIQSGARHAIIRLQRRSETKTFFERNRDQLVMMIITGLFGILIGVLGTKAKDHFYPPASATTGTK